MFNKNDKIILIGDSITDAGNLLMASTWYNNIYGH